MCAIYVALPKACADQWGNCTRPDLRRRSGICDVHGGILVGQRHDQIQIVHGRDDLDHHATGTMFMLRADLSQPPACLPMLSVNSTAPAHSLGETKRLS